MIFVDLGAFWGDFGALWSYFGATCLIFAYFRWFLRAKAPKEGTRRALVAERHIFATFFRCPCGGRHGARWPRGGRREAAGRPRGGREEAAGRPQGGSEEAARRLQEAMVPWLASLRSNYVTTNEVMKI